METARLRQFLVLCETQNLRKAAELMHMSHSAFHKSLQVLQGEMRAQLYALNGRNIVITPKGKVFYEQALKMLESEKALFALDKKADEAFKISTHETFSTYLLAPYWKKYFAESSLYCREMIPGRIEEAVLSGLADVGITYEPVPRSGLEFLKVAKVEMQVYALKGAFDKINVAEDFSKLPFVAPITPVDSVPSGARGLDGWPDNIIQRRVLYKVDLLSTAMQMVSAGHCAVFIPDFVAKTHNAQGDKKLEKLTLPSPFKKVQRDVSLVHKLGAEESVEIKRIAKMIRGEVSERN